MRHKVVQKQPSSKMCIVCGWDNDFSLKASFFEMDNRELVALFTPREEHQSYPGILHGGMSSAVIDETIVRIYMGRQDDAWAVTTELNIRYLKAVPLNQALKVVGRITKEDDKFFEGTGEIILENGDVAVSGFGKYRKLSSDKISEADIDLKSLGWKVMLLDDDPTDIDL